MGKLIVVTAPSGAGKTTIVRHLLNKFDSLAFSVSATTRPKRENEVEGKDYYFVSVDTFKSLVQQGAFLEWQEVYDNSFYGTLKSEVERLWAEGKHVVFDIDVQGALNLQKNFPQQTLTIFIKPPSTEILLERLKKRQSESEESLRKRIEKATRELTYENRFHHTIVNDVLENTLSRAENLVKEFLSNPEVIPLPGTSLKPGDKAPDFSGFDERGKPVSLAKFRGHKLVLFFYPQDNSPTCTVEACNLRDHYQSLRKKGYRLLGVSPDSARRHQNFILKHQLPFPLLVDTDRKVIDAYGVWGWKKTFGVEHEGVHRTTFIIDENGVIEKIITKVDSKRHANQILEEQP